MSSLWATGVDAHLVSFIEAWLKGRTLKTRLTAPEGRFFSKAKSISGGLPQGGVLSPLLWLVPSNGLFRVLERPLGTGMPADTEGRAAYGICLVCTDDVAIAYAHESAAQLATVANNGDGQTRRDLAEETLALGLSKCRNMVLSPGGVVGTVSRMNNGLSRAVNSELDERDRRLADLAAALEDDQLPWVATRSRGT